MKKKIKAVIELVRPLNCAMAGLAVAVGIAGSGLSFSFWQILIAPLTAVFVMAGGNTMNDYFDREIDTVSHKERPIPSGRLSPSIAVAISAIWFVGGIILSFLLNYFCVFIVILNICLLLIYENYLKKRGLLGNITVSYLVASLFLFGGVAIEKVEPVIFFCLLAFFANLGREILKDVEDIQGDFQERKTLPIKIGEKKAGAIAMIFILIAVILSPFPLVLGIISNGYLCVVFADIVFLASCTAILRSATLSQKLVKAGMLLAVFSFLLGGIT